jgi:RES domain-containing protein
MSGGAMPPAQALQNADAMRTDRQQQAMTPLAGVFFRAASPDDADLLHACRTSRSDPGRFNTPSVGALYVANDPETALGELRRTIAREGSSLVDAHPCAIIAVRAALNAVLDLTDGACAEQLGLSDDDLTSEDMDACQRVADRAARDGAEAIRWPSATGCGESLAIFVERLRPRSCAEPVATVELTPAMLRALEQGRVLREVIAEIDAIRPGASRD